MTTLESEILNNAATGIIVAVAFGGLFVLILWAIARYRRYKGKPASMKSVCYWIVAGCVGCVFLHTMGYQAFGSGALVLAAIAGISTWSRSTDSS